MADAIASDSPPRTGLAKAQEVAEYLRTTPNQLTRLRFEGRGPQFVRLGRSIRYRWVDVHRWVDESVHTTGARDGAR